MDQASIRIIVQDEGTIAPSNAQGPSPSAPNPNPYAPQQQSSQYSASQQPPRIGGPTPAQLPTQRFDPVAEAGKMREAEIRREMVKATYDRLYDTADKTKSALDSMLEIALKMRGTLGGAFGGLAGPVLDIYAAYKATRKSDTRLEAEKRLGFAGGGEIPPAPGVPLNADEVPVRATAGEFIVNKAAAQVPENRAVLEKMNKQTSGITPSQVADIVFDSPNNKLPPDIDKEDARRKFIDYFGVTGTYERTDASVDALKKDLESGKIKTIKPPDQDEVKRKAGSGKFNDVLLVTDKSGQTRILDGTHSLLGAIESGTKNIGVIKQGKSPEHHASGGMVGGSRHYASGGSVPSPPKPSPSASSGVADALMVAAPEIGIVLKIAELAGDAIVGAIRSKGDTLNSAISPDANAARSVSELGENISRLNPLIGETTSAFGRLMGTMGGVATRYAEFSPEIAQAQGAAEIRQTMGDLRRGQEAGGDLARYIQMQTDVQQKFEDIKIKVLLKILPIVELVGTLLGEAVSTGADVTSAIIAIATPLNALATIARAINGTMEDANREEPQDPTNLIIDLRNGAPGPGLGLPPPT